MRDVIEVPSPFSGLGDQTRKVDLFKRSARVLEHEGAPSRAALMQTIRELRRANRELLTLNRDIQKTNEDLQATNSELEFSNEELQSINEQLIALNGDLQFDAMELRARQAADTA